MDTLRIYEPSECGKDGYPLAWHKGEPAVKDLVRELADHRCVRCQHPYVVGQSPGEWSPCSDSCTHRGPWKIVHANGEYTASNTERRSVSDAVGITDEHYSEWIAPEILAQWRVLTVHHLTGDKCDLRWWNLAALCQRCHLEIQGRVRMEQVYPHEHSEWFKPYAAGYYAATYLNEDLTREETLARLNELLALERAPEIGRAA